MGGSSSQPRTDPPLSPINAFSLGDFCDLTNEEEEGNPQPPKKGDSNQACTSVDCLTTEEEIALAKGWHSVSESSERGNARKKDGFWVEVLAYVESKTK
ncbi:hypothetical protein Tco_1230630 [Tanacetum coccineum]